MKVLVTGHSGFLGGHVAARLLRKGCIVYGASRSSRPDCEISQYSLDVTDTSALSRLVGEKEIGTIIHCAAKPLVANCEKDPFGACQSNILGTASVLEALRRNPATRKLVVIETDKVYGFQEKIPTKEDAIPNPGSPYEISKAMASQLCSFYREHYGLEIISVRPVNLFGPGDYSFSRIIPAAMRAVAKGGPIEVHNPHLSVQRDFLYVKDAAKMIVELALKNALRYDTYNLSFNQFMSIREMADRIQEALDHRVEHLLVTKDERAKEIPFQSIDGSRISEELSLEATPLAEALRETYEFYK